MPRRSHYRADPSDHANGHTGDQRGTHAWGTPRHTAGAAAGGAARIAIAAHRDRRSLLDGSNRRQRPRRRTKG